MAAGMKTLLKLIGAVVGFFVIGGAMTATILLIESA
jgi:hypothetical protein